MKARAALNVVTTLAIVLLGLSSSRAQSIQSSVPSAPDPTAKPLLLERNEGELRIRRIHTDASMPAASQFMLKVSPKNNGSQHLVLGIEELAPGAALPKHKHLIQDEIVLIQSGTAHVWLGDQEGDVHAGRACVYSGQYLGRFEEHWHRTHQPYLYLLSARIRRHDAMQLRASR
ncbi:MAG: cupin domain-containing protein [Candidatus Angelobacter sp.]